MSAPTRGLGLDRGTPELRPNTIRLYRYLLRTHIAAHFENVGVNEIKEPQVRRWRKKLLDSGVSEITTAKACRLLKAILEPRWMTG
ncbi:MAG: site-specific integrase [Streptosporangiaceae bacterium]|jgi:hypothetical protein